MAKIVNFTGTVSWGTMRAQDVLPAIMDVLEEFHPDAYAQICAEIEEEFGFDYDSLAGCANFCETDEYLVCKVHGDVWNSEAMSYIINETAWDAMQELAPEGYYSGAHPGDCSDYGYWPNEEDDWEGD